MNKSKKLLRKLILEQLIESKKNDFKGPSSFLDDTLEIDLKDLGIKGFDDDTLTLTQTQPTLGLDTQTLNNTLPYNVDPFSDTESMALSDIEVKDLDDTDSMSLSDIEVDDFDSTDSFDINDTTEIIGSKFGDESDDHPANVGLKSFLGSGESPTEHRRKMLARINQLKRDLNENRFDAKTRIKKMIQLSICESVLRRIL